MVDMDLQQVYYFVTLFAVGYACQDPWTIESPMLKPGTLINFKNSSSVGDGESLTWTWTGPRGEVWENRIWYTRADKKMGGSWLFRERVKHTKNVVQLEWERAGDETKWNYDSKMIKQQGWKIVVRDVIELNFIPLERDWVFRVGDDQLFGTGLQTLDDEEEEQYDGGDSNEEDDDDDDDDSAPEDPENAPSRQKRSPQTESMPPTEAGFGDWMKSVWSYFFGDGDVARGEPEGIFSRMGKWLRGVSCSLGGPCDRDVPDDLSQGPFPTPTMPPMSANPATFNPDAEILPEVNDVKK